MFIAQFNLTKSFEAKKLATHCLNLAWDEETSVIRFDGPCMQCPLMDLQIAEIHAVHQPCSRNRRPQRSRNIGKRVGRSCKDDGQ